MLKAKKGNRVVRIPDTRKNDYIAMGYTITTMDGKTVHEPVKATALQAEVEKLTGQLKEATAKPAAQKAPDAGKQAETDAKATK